MDTRTSTMMSPSEKPQGSTNRPSQTWNAYGAKRDYLEVLDEAELDALRELSEEQSSQGLRSNTKQPNQPASTHDPRNLDVKKYLDILEDAQGDAVKEAADRYQTQQAAKGRIPSKK